eukprot:4334013-Amphidinium_carterae.1
MSTAGAEASQECLAFAARIGDKMSSNCSACKGHTEIPLHQNRDPDTKIPSHPDSLQSEQ